MPITSNFPNTGDRGPTSDIWRVPRLELDRAMMYPGEIGYHAWDDFQNSGLGLVAGAANTAQGQYVAYADTGCSVLPVEGVEHGVLAMTCDTTDNRAAGIQAGGSLSGVGAPEVKLDLAKPLCFEARLKVSTISATTPARLFVGLAEQGELGSDSIWADDSDAFATGLDAIGFRRPEADADGLDFVYRASGQTEVIALGDIALAADTFLKVGWLYMPDVDPSRRITVFVNGVAVAFVTAAAVAAATFPGGAYLARASMVKGAGTATTHSLDWWRLYQKGYTAT